MLGKIFAGNPPRPCRPPNLTENTWTLHELQCAVRRMKIHKGADEAGLLAELLKNSMLIAGSTSGGRTTRVPKTSADGRTLADRNVFFGQDLGQRNSSMDCESRTVKSF